MRAREGRPRHPCICMSKIHYVIECLEHYDLCSIVTQKSLAKSLWLVCRNSLAGYLPSTCSYILSLVAMPHHCRWLSKSEFSASTDFDSSDSLLTHHPITHPCVHLYVHFTEVYVFSRTVVPRQSLPPALIDQMPNRVTWLVDGTSHCGK